MENKVRFRPLARSADFLKLRESGQSFHINSWLLINLQKTSSKEFRLGWTIPRQIGNAVVRNRLRRWGREYLRKWCKEAGKSLDLNLILKRKDKAFYKALTHKDLDDALGKMVEKVERIV